MNNKLANFILENSHDLKSTIATAKSFLNILELKQYHMDKEETKELSDHLNIQLTEYLKKIEEIIKLASLEK